MSTLQFNPDSAAREAIMGKANAYGERLAMAYDALGTPQVSRHDVSAQQAANALRKEIDRQIKDAYLRGCVEATERGSA